MTERQSGTEDNALLRLRRSALTTSKRLLSVKETISPRQVAKEAVRAMIVWFVIYLVLFIILLGYKWQTKTYYAENPNPSPITQSVVKNVIKTVKKTNKNDLSQHEKTLKATIKAYEKAAEGHQSELKELQETTKILHEYHDKIWALNLANEKPSSETMKLEIDTLKDLLETQAISSMEDPTPSFQKANKELEGLISNKDIVDWQAVNEIFQKDFPDKLASRNNVKCSRDGKSLLIPDNVARVSEMQERLQKVDTLLEKRKITDDPHYPMTGDALLPKSKMVLERALNKNIKVLLKDIVEEAQTSSATTKCFDEDNVIQLVEDGLTALLRKADLRNFLRGKAIQLDPSATSVILDADLPMMEPKIPDPETINLRRIIDKPILFEVIDWVDKVVEAIGGYNDDLDQYLDQVAGSSSASIGKLLVDKLLEASEKVDLPHPRKLEQLSKKYIAS